MILQYWSTIFQSTSDAVIWLRGWPQLWETGLRLGLLVKPGSFTEKQWCLGLHRFKISSKHHHFFQDFWKCGRLLVSFQVRRKKSERSFPSIFPRIFFYHLLIKSVIKVEMEMQFRTLSYTGTETPSLHTLLNECPALSCPLMIPHCPPAMSTSGAGRQHPLCPAFTVSGRRILIGAVSPSYPLHLMVFSTAPVSAPASFFPFFEKLLKRGVSIHWLSFLTSHSTLNPQQSDFNSRFPLPVTISVDSRKTSMNSSILFRNLFFWYVCLCKNSVRY